MAPNKEMEGETFTLVTTKRRRRSSGKKRDDIYIIPPSLKTDPKQTVHSQELLPPNPRLTSQGREGARAREHVRATRGGAKKSGEISDFMSECLKQGILLEALVIEYTLAQKGRDLFTSEKDSDNTEKLVKKFAFVHQFGDHFTTLNVARDWIKQVGKKNVPDWCKDCGINPEEVKHMEKYLERRRKEMKVAGSDFCFSTDPEKADEILMKILLEQNQEGLCVYKGHPSLGYWSVSKWRTLHLGENSVLRQVGSYNKYILALQDVSSDDTIFNALVCDNEEAERILNEKFTSSVQILNEIRLEASHLAIKSEIVRDEIQQRFEADYKGSLRRRVEEVCEDSTVYLSNITNGLTVCCLQKHKETVLKILEDETKTVESELGSRLVELPYPDKGSSVRALLSSGSELQRILLPYQYRSVLVRETKPDELTLDHVMKTMATYGHVESVNRRNDEERRKDGKWGIITFQKPESVQELLANYSKCENMLVELAPLSKSRRKLRFSVEHEVNVRVSYCRRPVLSRKASVHFRARKDFSKALRAKDFTVRNHIISGLKPGPQETFIMEGLHVLTNEDDVITGLKTVALTPSDVTLHRVEAFECSPQELEKFKGILVKELDKVTDTRKVNVKVMKSSPEDLDLQALITFDKHRTAVSALDRLEKLKINGLPLNIHSDTENNPSTPAKVSMDPELYNIVKTDLEILHKKLRRKLSLDMTTIPTGKRVDVVLGKDTPPQGVEAFLEGVGNILTPVIFNLKRANARYLTMGKGKDMVTAVQSKTKCLIDISKDCVNIYGSPSAKSKAAESFKSSLAEKKIWHRFPIPQECPNPLKGIPQACEKFLEINSDMKLFDERSKSFIFSSTEDGSSVVDSLRGCFERSERGELGGEEDCPDCSACICPPASASDVYYLSTCGHPYCTDCIHEHVKHAITDMNFPVKCIHESCQASICVPELLNLAYTSLKGSVEFMSKMVVDSYVAQHTDKWMYCFKPYCQGLAYKDERFNAYTCNSCSAQICKKCSNARHPGDCDEHLNIRCLNLWFAESDDRRKCPKCKMGIEKVDGCNRVYCSSCHAHICWRCMQYYMGMDECYDHLNKEHGGPY